MELLGATTEKIRLLLATDPRAVGVMPFGAVEQHGPHLPLGTDFIGAEHIARRICESTGAILLPSIPFGVSGHHSAWPGTVALSATTFMNVVEEVVRSLASHGLRRFLWLNHHGGNGPALQLSRQRLSLEPHRVQIALPAPDPRILERRYTTMDVHAGKAETDFMLTIAPSMVDMSAVAQCAPQALPDSIAALLGDPNDPVKRTLLDACLPARTEALSTSGVISTLDLRQARGDSGPFIERWVVHLGRIIEAWREIPDQ